ncbi:hypothetical protein [Opitutus terrae]|uniref:Uncharacterized protein n=1 Tax=Opitutus terrae (strain DSM 11246 / JCM 15787 / PB90-1) TaxID=452637 RepID=B1ZNQ9_OPITP|nr:hypothetical protein [Opitutus terrae]ACB75429.1 hypothetical protein Oter_2146 [Opitutus terrae PB90-1]
MPLRFPPCPTLPVAPGELDWRTLHAFREQHRRAEFYAACLAYAQSLWTRGLAARAMLCLDRAFSAELQGDEAELRWWPLPYAAMAWIITHTPDGVFMGNPRVHFQHYAGRVNEPRKEQRRWRAWACWALTRRIRPDLPADPRHAIVEPTAAEIEARLRQHGLPGEPELWREVMGSASTIGPTLGGRAAESAPASDRIRG